MQTPKYITFEGVYAPEIVVWGGSISHADMAQNLHIKKDDLIGAGFVQIELNRDYIVCYGQSISLGISAHERDTDLFRQQLLDDD